MIIIHILEAARIIYLLTKNPSEGKRKKKIFDQDLGLFEALLESVPSVIVLSIISVFGGKQCEILSVTFKIKLFIFFV